MNKQKYTDFAWECLRRNPRYILDWEIAKEEERYYDGEITGDGVKEQNIVDLNAEKKWGLMKYVAPNDSNPIDVFWSFRLSKRSVRLAVSTSGDFTWDSIASKPGVYLKKIRLMDHSLCVKIFNNNSYFQFFYDSNAVLDENQSLFLYIPLNLQTDAINKNIDMIKAIINHRSETDEKERHYLELLKTIDDRKQGFTHRDIAAEIFGKELVKNEWSSDSWLRANVRYRLKKANDLINNGYLDYI